jgi:hypothetical protein
VFTGLERIAELNDVLGETLEIVETITNPP